MTNSYLLKVLDNFNIENAASCKLLSGGTANTSYLVECDRAKYVIRRRSSKYSIESWVLYEAEYLGYLYKKGVPVPILLAGRDGQYWCNVEGSMYQLYTFIDGSSYDYSSKDELIQSAVFLGKLHSVVCDFCPDTLKESRRYDNPVEMLDMFRKSTEKTRCKTGQEERRILGYVEKQIENIAEKLTDDMYYSLPLITIHGDYHPANVKYKAGRVCGLFDFDRVSMQPRIRDVSDGVIYFSSIRSGKLSGGDIFSLTGGYMPDLDRSLVFMHGYIKNVTLGLSEREIKLIPCFMRVRLINSRIEALSKIPESKTIEMLTTNMEPPLRWLEDNKDIFIEKCMQFLCRKLS
jgi:Ser/Thr protein kinase RdoA (MazF antagonist)